MVKGKMNMEKIFNLSHGALDMSKMKSLSDAMEEGLTEEYFGVNDEEAQEAIDYLGVDARDLYREPDNFISPINYIKGFVLIGVHSLEVKFLEMFQVKQSIEMWTRRFDGYAEKEDWSSLIEMSDKRISLLRFLESYRDIPKSDIIDIFAEMYCRQEFGFYLINEEIINYIYSGKEDSPQWKERMAELPAGEELTVYRGSSRDIIGGYSWTTKIETARFFANRYGNIGNIYIGKVRREDVLDYFTGRDESEILVNPKDVIGVSVYRD